MTDTPTQEKDHPKFWAIGGDVWTFTRHDDLKALVALSQTEVEDMLRFYADCPMSEDAIALRKAIDDRDEWRKLAYAH